MVENSIKEDIKIVENYLANSAINETDSNFFKNGGWETVDLEIPKSMQHILSDYKRVLKENEVLLKENEELKFKEKSRIIGRYGDIEIHDLINKTLSKDYIPVQKVKDKIDEILNNGEYRIIFEGDAEFPDEATIINAQRYIKLEKLQELLEGRK